jgi:hypothetical protein
MAANTQKKQKNSQLQYGMLIARAFFVDRHETADVQSKLRSQLGLAREDLVSGAPQCRKGPRT